MPTPITSPSSQIAECVKRKQEYQELLDKRDAKKQRPRESSQLAAEPDANPGAAFLEAHPEPTATTPRTEPYCKPQRNTIRCYPLVWELDNHRAPAHLQAYSERAARWQSSLVVDKMPTLAELRRSVVDGHVLLGRRGRFVQMSMSCSEWHSTNYWRSFAEKFEVEETDASCSLLTSDTSLGPHKIGSGSYNVVFTLRGGSLPSELGENLCVRLTRPDPWPDGSFRFSCMNSCLSELKNTLFLSSAGLGTPVRMAAVFSAPRPASRIKFGTLLVAERAESDLTHFMKKADEGSGRRAGLAVADLLFRSAMHGVAFFDIKPSNILMFKDASGDISVGLTDADAMFFTTTQRDWRALFLMNAALLLAHVKNASYRVAGRVFIDAFKPILVQLVQRRGDYDSAWLFFPPVCSVEIDGPVVDTEFSLQFQFLVMTTSYFYGKNVDKVYKSTKHRWQSRDKELGAYWKRRENRSAWPPRWRSGECRYKPAITQLVEFATGEEFSEAEAGNC